MRTVHRVGGYHRAKKQNSLTPREYEVALFASRRMTNAQIAKQLAISRLTVKNHVHEILAKTGLKRKSELITAEILPGPSDADLQTRLDVLGTLVDQLRAEYEAVLHWVRNPENAFRPVDV